MEHKCAKEQENNSPVVRVVVGIRRLSRKDMEGVLRVSVAVKRHCDHSNISKENSGSDLQVQRFI